MSRDQGSIHNLDMIGGLYCKGRKLGSGSFGDIYFVVNVQTGQELAVKLESTKTKHPQLMYEAKLLKHLEGVPGIAHVHYFGVQGDFNAMVIDLLGHSLEGLFNVCKRRFSLKTVLMVADQMLYRIEYLHSKNFIHRDIKPANMLLSTPDDVHPHLLIADFGVAEMFASSCFELKGTFAYMAPEVFSNESTPRSDVWALGICTYELLCGKRPFSGSNQFAVYGNVRRKEPDYEKLESPKAKDFVKQALVKNEPERPLASELLSCSWFTASRFELTDHSQKKIKQSFENYARSSHFAKVVLNCVAVQLNSSELSDLSEYFDLLDTDADGCITPLALRSTLKSFGLEGEFDQLWGAIDINHDGQLQYCEFIASMLSTRPKLLDDAMLRVFTLFDTDNDNAMSFQELTCMLSGSPNQGVLPDGMTIERLMGEMDSGMDGTITFSDFRSYFLKELQKGPSVVGVESVASALKNIAVVVGRSESEMQVQADYLSEKHWITTIGDLKQLSRQEWSRLGIPSKLENALRNYVGMG
mmetsp:Transcript_54856/g.146458  ORF Transcript_54856/g.146458 Transcript_54856/m.146458 type:complete len:528 (-) Transcript_54856:116-1699(-)